jgi:predicted PurR-regulated permease PerM
VHFKLLLQPAFRILERLHVPRILASLLLILALFGLPAISEASALIANSIFDTGDVKNYDQEKTMN